MKINHPFDPRKGQPPYWLRNNPAEIAQHRDMLQKFERVHFPKKFASIEQEPKMNKFE